LRQGYFFADPVESRPGAPVFNRIIGLKDTWTKAPDKVEERRPEKPRTVQPAATKKRSDARDAARAGSPELAERFGRYQAKLGLPEDDADLLTGNLELARYFDAAVEAAKQPRAKSVAKWLLNDLVGLAKEQPLAELPLTAVDFGAFVAMVDAGQLAPAAAKTVLARLVKTGGTPEAVIKEMGLGKVEGSAALDGAVSKVIAAHAAEVQRYRAGEKKLLGVLIGAVMKETQGTADAAAVRAALTKSLGQ
jgi:Asp-tRNA(Asn)/Glu-tRNA(Gln) amidotransferase B subunit